MDLQNYIVKDYICPNCRYTASNTEQGFKQAKEAGLKVEIELGKKFKDPSTFWITCPVCKETADNEKWIKEN